MQVFIPEEEERENGTKQKIWTHNESKLSNLVQDIAL